MRALLRVIATKKEGQKEIKEIEERKTLKKLRTVLTSVLGACICSDIYKRKRVEKSGIRILQDLGLTRKTCAVFRE